MLKQFCLLVILFVVFKTAVCQDIHWSQFNDNQLFQNPGQAGHFDGDYRFIANYRDQWRSVTIPYNTFSMLAYARFNRLGAGLLMFHDQAGCGTF